jgi:hypothetical protein
MLRWLERLFRRKNLGPGPSTATVAAARENPPRRRLTLDDAKYVEAALNDLAKVGLRFAPGAREELNAIATDIVRQLEGISFGKEPTAGNWALIALGSDVRPFENAIFYQDHSFDGITLEDYSSMVSQIIALARDQWPVEGVEVRDALRPQDRGYGTVSLAIKAMPEVSSFELLNAKDFDWSIIFRLNERLPKGASGRFAIFLDGNATIVFLAPDQIRLLNSVCGYEFFYKEDPETRNSVL